MDGLKAALRAMLPEPRRRWPIDSLGVFGSWVLGEQHPESDVDLLVELDREPFGFAERRGEIARRLCLRVGLVHRPGLKPFAGTQVLAEVQPA